MKGVDGNSLTDSFFGSDDEQAVEAGGALSVAAVRRHRHFRLILNRNMAKSLGQLASRVWCRKGLVAVGHPNLTEVIERIPPILFIINDFIADDRPLNVVRFSCWTASSIHAETRITANLLWSTLYERRWPAFHDALSHMSKGTSVDWCTHYKETLFGKTKLTLEVYHRELKLGFMMSVMPANVWFQAKVNAYVAEYISASKVHPEAIPAADAHRLRFCPASIRQRLELNSLAPLQMQDQDEKALCYPYRVLQGSDGLVPGKGVELQWKMQQASPFGWWYGTLESIAYEDSGPHATATITFGHFPRDSRWHRMQVRFGDSVVRTNPYGGFTGGIRACSDAETGHWKQFFPKTLRTTGA